MTFAQTPFHDIAFVMARRVAILATRCADGLSSRSVAKHLIYVIYMCVLLLCPVGLMGQTFGWSWIKGSEQKIGGHQWFRQTYTNLGTVHDATLRVATTGYVKVYVNGRQVSTDPITPYRPTNSGEAVALTYHVAPFLRPDSVHIAVWYAPVPQVNDSCQLAVSFFGEDVDGERFGFQTDDTWLCRPAASWYYDDAGVVGEGSDGCAMQPEWTFGDTDWALWQPTQVVNEPGCRLVVEADSRERLRLKRVYKASLCNSALDNEQLSAANNRLLMANSQLIITNNHLETTNNQLVKSNHSLFMTNNLTMVASKERVTAVFSQPFFGFVRVTMRGARRGERIVTDNGLAYICNNQMDEQLFNRFIPCQQNVFSVMGDHRFKASQVQYVEGLELSTYMLLPWMNN